jgi:hypothetical protein
VAAAGYQTFASQFTAAGSQPIHYCITDPVSGAWEIGNGAFSKATFIITRNALNVYSGSAGAGTLVDFVNGSLDVFSTVSAENVVTYQLSTSPISPIYNRLLLNPPLTLSGYSGSVLITTTTATTGSTAGVTIGAAGAPTTYVGNPGSTNITSGAGGQTSTGGAINITAGVGGSFGATAATNGGIVTINGGLSGYLSGLLEADGGGVNILGGATSATSSSKSGGGVNVRGGNSSTGGNGGGVSIFGGTNSGGGATNGNGGSVSIYPGNGNTSAGVGSVNGSVVISSALGNSLITIKDNATAGQMGFFAATPIAKPTTAITGTTPVINSGTAVNTGTTFEGYTIAQIATILKTLGLLT